MPMVAAIAMVIRIAADFVPGRSTFAGAGEGQPQCGQVTASVLIVFPHSRQRTIAMFSLL
jgi:hypothetical protein